MLRGFLLDLLILPRIGQQRKQNRVSSLAEDLDLPVGLLDDDGHPFALRVELNHIQQLILVQLRLLVVIVLNDELISVVPLHELYSIVLGGVEQGEFVRAGTREQRLDRFVFRIVAGQDSVAKRQMVEETLYLLVLMISLILDHLLQV